jgi:carbon monoxide dehydrogenase subunit G
MQIENQFDVASPPERVYEFLLDVNRVVTCMPGAELSETVDADTFRGRVRIKVGPITVAYNGTARITERDPAARVAKLEAEGRETTGPGSARATAVMTVEPTDGGSRVKLTSDFTVAGRVANFGRGVMEDVSRRLVAQMADCIKAQLEATPAAQAPTAQAPTEAAGQAPTAQAPAAPAEGGAWSSPGGQPPAAQPPGGQEGAAGPEPGSQPAPAPGPARASAPTPPRPAPAQPVNALSLFFSVLWDRVRRMFGGS